MGEDKNAIAKRQMIIAYFNRAEQRHAFLRRLIADGHLHEAMTLCPTYIDSVAQWLFWPRGGTGRNFVDALNSFADDPLFALVHPLQVIRALRRMGAPWPGIAARIHAAYPGPQYELQVDQALAETLKPHLEEAELRQLSRELWRGSISAVGYYNLRNPSVHSFGGGGTINFDDTTWQGRPVPALDFDRMHLAAGRLITEARRRSVANDQWFGNDSIVHDP